MQQGNRHCTANIRNTRAHSSRRWRIRKRRNRTLQVVGRFLTLFVLTLVLAVGIMLSGAALLGWWPSKEIPRQENSASTPLLTPAQTPEPLTVDVSGINSPYALLMCRDGTELGQESADASIYPASMTKIMTVLLGVENIPDLDAEVTLDPDIFNDLWAENASMAGFAPGETVTVRDILYGSLLPSGAECSVTIAQLVDSGVEAFADRMNNRAAEIGMQHTHFTNPTGLHLMKSEIRFKDREHLAFYNMVLKQTRKDDPYHKAFFYVVGISSDTRNNIQKIFDFEEDCIRPDCINDGWQTSGTERITRLAFNLWNGWNTDGYATPYDLFDCEFAPYFMEGIRLRYPEYCRELESQPPKWER